jgi:hypothetical protein
MTHPAAVAYFESLTTPDSEDWMIIPDGNDVHVSAVREIVHEPEPQAEGRYGLTSLADFKHGVETLPEGHGLGCVAVIVCQDFKDTGAVRLLTWLKRQAKAKGFNLTSIHGSATTAEAIKAMKSEFIQ